MITWAMMQHMKKCFLCRFTKSETQKSSGAVPRMEHLICFDISVLIVYIYIYRCMCIYIYISPYNVFSVVRHAIFSSSLFALQIKHNVQLWHIYIYYVSFAV